MVDRSQRILYELIRTKGPRTSIELADAVGVSVRTIKNEMPRVSRLLTDNGARLEARRNYGYSIIIVDAEAYERLTFDVTLNASNVMASDYDDESRLLYICRRIVAASGGVKVEELCDELCLSRTAIRKPLKEAYEFCRSFRLNLMTLPHHGICCEGVEHMWRLAMVELFEIHFHKYVPRELDQDYGYWMACPDDERQEIRHIFLATLRNSSIALRDGTTQKIAIYLMLARNRHREGMKITLPAPWVHEIAETPFFSLAKEIFHQLETEYDDFNGDEQETAFLAMYMLANMDVNLYRDIAALFPDLYQDTASISEESIIEMQRVTGLTLTEAPWFELLAQHALLPLVAAGRYGMDGCCRFDIDSEQFSVQNPLQVYLAGVFGDIVNRIAGLRLSSADILPLATLMAGLLEMVELPTEPLRLLVTSAMGVEYARLVGERVRQTFPGLVAATEPFELYEIRGLDTNQYDAVVTDVEPATYNYAYPMARMSLGQYGLDLERVHDTLLINAYVLDGLLPDSNHVRIYSSGKYRTFDDFLKVLYLRDCENESVSEGTDILKSNDILKRCVGQSSAFLFSVANSENNERIELYAFESPLKWGGKKVRFAVYARLFLGKGLEGVKVRDRLFTMMRQEKEYFSELAFDPKTTLDRLTRASFKLRS